MSPSSSPHTSLRATVVPSHRRMEALFQAHQESLLLQDLPLAERFLGAFAEHLRCHIETENTWILALLSFRQLELRWEEALYRKEHDKILQMLRKVQDALRDLPAEPGQFQRLGILQLLDYERSFKGVLEHHEEREEMALLLELDEQLAPAELAGLCQRCEQAWQDLVDLDVELCDLALR